MSVLSVFLSTMHRQTFIYFSYCFLCVCVCVSYLFHRGCSFCLNDFTTNNRRYSVVLLFVCAHWVCLVAQAVIYRLCKTFPHLHYGTKVHSMWNRHQFFFYFFLLVKKNNFFLTATSFSWVFWVSFSLLCIVNFHALFLLFSLRVCVCVSRICFTGNVPPVIPPPPLLSPPPTPRTDG